MILIIKLFDIIKYEFSFIFLKILTDQPKVGWVEIF